MIQRFELSRPAHFALALGGALLLSLAAPDTAAAQAATRPTAPPQSQPTSRPADDDLDRRLDAVTTELERQMAEHHVPGLGLAVVRGDDVLLCTGLGRINLDTGEPTTGDTMFAIGSSTKAFTATLIGMLIDDGVIESWDARPQKFLPDFHLNDEQADAEVTFRDLLSHQTGLSRMGLLWASGGLDRDQVIRRVQDAELLYGFRSQFNYSNINFIVAGEASARAADMAWKDLLQQRLLDPLQMTGATTSVADARAGGALATGYRWDEDRGDYVVENLRDIAVAAPAGAINASPREMANWLRFQINRGVFNGTRLISTETLEQTWQPQVEVGNGISYGLGWMVGDWRGHRLVQHGGNIDGFAAQVAFLPDEHVGYVLLTNTSFNALQATGNTAVFEALLEDASDTTPDIDYTPYLGRYIADFGPFKDQRFTVQVNDGKLAVDVPGQMLYELNPPDDEGKWTFAITDAIAVSFDRNDDGAVTALKMHQGGLTFELPREGVELEPEVTLSDVRDYLGAYHDDRLDADIEIKLHNGRLAADVPGQMVFDLRKPEKDGRWVFRATDAISMTFHRNDEGEVDSLTLTERGVDRLLPRVAGAEADDADIPTLDEVMALHNAAHGTAALDDLKTYIATGTVQFVHQGVTGRFIAYVRGVDAHRLTLDLGASGIIDLCTTADSGWTWSSLEPFEELEGDYLRAAQRQHPLSIVSDFRDFSDNVELREVTDLDGRPHDALLVRMSDRVTSTVYIDAETGLVTQEDLTMMARGVGPLPMEVHYSDYRAVAGVMLPFHVEVKNQFNGTMIMNVESIKPNVDLPEDAFVRPEKLEPADAT